MDAVGSNRPNEANLIDKNNDKQLPSVQNSPEEGKDSSSTSHDETPNKELSALAELDLFLQTSTEEVRQICHRYMNVSSNLRVCFRRVAK